MDSKIDEDESALFVEKVRKMKFKLPPPPKLCSKFHPLKSPTKLPDISPNSDVRENKSAVSAAPPSPTSSTAETSDISSDSGIQSDTILDTDVMMDDAECTTSNSIGANGQTVSSDNILSPSVRTVSEKSNIPFEAGNGQSPKRDTDMEGTAVVKEDSKESWEYDELLRPIVYSSYIEKKLETWKSDLVRSINEPLEQSRVPIGRPYVPSRKSGLFKFLTYKQLSSTVFSRIPQAIINGTPIDIWDPTSYITSVSPALTPSKVAIAKPTSTPNTSAAAAPSIPRKRISSLESSQPEPATKKHKAQTENGDSFTANDSMDADMDVDEQQRKLIASSTSHSNTTITISDQDDDIVCLREIKRTSSCAPNLLERVVTPITPHYPPKQVDIVSQTERKLIAHLSALCGTNSVNLDDPQWFPKLRKMAEMTVQEQDKLIAEDQQLIRAYALDGKRLRDIAAKYRDSDTTLVRRNIFASQTSHTINTSTRKTPNSRMEESARIVSPVPLESANARPKHVNRAAVYQSCGVSAGPARHSKGYVIRDPPSSTSEVVPRTTLSSLPLPTSTERMQSAYFDRTADVATNPIGKIAYAPARHSPISLRIGRSGVRAAGSSYGAGAGPTSRTSVDDVIVLDDDDDVIQSDSSALDSGSAQSQPSSIVPLQDSNSTAYTPIPTPTPSMNSPSLSPCGSTNGLHPSTVVNANKGSSKTPFSPSFGLGPPCGTRKELGTDVVSYQRRCIVRSCSTGDAKPTLSKPVTTLSAGNTSTDAITAPSTTAPKLACPYEVVQLE